MDDKKEILAIKQLSSENEWLGNIAEKVNAEFAQHQRGFLIVPFSHLEDIDVEHPKKTVLLTNLEPPCFMAAISGAIKDYAETYYKIATGEKAMSANKIAKIIWQNIKQTGGAE